MGQAAHVGARGLMGEDQRVGLAAMDQRHGHARVGDVVEAPLPLDEIPVVRVIVGRQPLHRPSHEVRDHRVERNARAGHEDPRLPGRAHGRLHAAPAHLGLHGHGRVHLSGRAVRADGEAALAGPRLAVRDGELLGRDAHVVERAPVLACRGDQIGLVAQQVVEAGGHVVAHGERLARHRLPALGDHAAPVGDTDHQRLRAGRAALLQRHLREAQIGAGVRQGHLPDGALGAPVSDAYGDLRGEHVGRIPEEQQVGGWDGGGHGHL